jgi:hypothetical protein
MYWTPTGNAPMDYDVDDDDDVEIRCEPAEDYSIQVIQCFETLQQYCVIHRIKSR